MARKKNEKRLTLHHASIQITMQEASNLVRWNPPLSLDWMEEVRPDVFSPLQIKMFNNCAKQMNDYLNCLEEQRYYNKKDYWGILKPSRVSLIQEVDLSAEDYLLKELYDD